MQKGQVLAVVLLILGVVATVALSVASRSVTEIRVSTTQDESSRALEAAEIGLERYIGDLSIPAPGHKVDVPDINAGYYIPSVDTGGGEKFYKVPYKLVAGDVATIDMPGCTGPACSQLDVCWGDVASAQDPKIEVSFFYVMQDGANLGRMAVRRIGFDHAGLYSGFLSGGINHTDDCNTGEDLKYRTRIGLMNDNPGNVDLGLGVNKLLFVRIRMLGNGSTPEPISVLITGGSNIPTQGGEIVAVGESGESVQKVRANVQLWDLPPMFDSAMFSGTSLTK